MFSVGDFLSPLRHTILMQYLTTAKWNWRLMRTIVTELHVYDEKVNYKPFDDYYPVSFLPPQRKMF